MGVRNMIPEDQKESMKMLIKNTLTLLCRNGLSFDQEFGVEALIGITVDKDDVFLVSMNEVVKKVHETDLNLPSTDQGYIPEEEDSGRPVRKKPKVTVCVDSSGELPATSTLSSLPASALQPTGETYADDSLITSLKKESLEDEDGNSSAGGDPAEEEELDYELHEAVLIAQDESDLETPKTTPKGRTRRRRKRSARSESNDEEQLDASALALEELAAGDLVELGEETTRKTKTKKVRAGSTDKRRSDVKGQRSRHETTLSTKIELIKDSMQTPKPTLKILAQKYDIGISTVHDILRKKNEYLAMYDKSSHAEKTRFKTDTRLDALDACVWSWHEQICIKNPGKPVPDDIIRDNAMRIAENMGMTHFKATKSWLDEWKSAYLSEDAS